MNSTGSTFTRRRLLTLTSAVAVAGQTNRHRTLHERLATQQGLLGLVQVYPNRSLEELAGECGYDFLMLDGEHGVFSDEGIRETLKRLAKTDIVSLLRVPKLDPRLVERYLEMGADVIVAPLVSTVEDAKAMASAAISRKGSLIVILETKRGVENAEAILAVDGIHGAMIGPGDLSTDFGIKGPVCAPDLLASLLTNRVRRCEGEKTLGHHAARRLFTGSTRRPRASAVRSDHRPFADACRVEL